MANEEDNEDGGGSSEYQKSSWATKERTRAILTKRDRKFLNGNLELEGQPKRNTEYKIRKRVINGILDLELIAICLRGKDWKKVLDSLFGKREVSPPVTRNEFDFFMYALTQLIIDGVYYRYGCPDTIELMKPLEEEIEKSLNVHLRDGELNIDFNFRPYDSDEAKEELLEKLLADKATDREYTSFKTHWGTAPLIDEMEERDIEQFVIQKYPDPATIVDLDQLKRELEFW